MKLPRTCTNKGFTLIEILITLGIFVILASLGLYVSLDSYRSYTFSSERDALVSLLLKARNQSMNNIDELPHGVHIGSQSFTLFEGVTYSVSNPKNNIIARNAAISVNGLTDVNFSQLSGDPSLIGSITLSYGARTAIISIENEGRINW